MSHYLVEAYLARTSERLVEEARARAAAIAVSESGQPIRLVTTIHIPDDEIAFHLFEAASPDVVRLVSERAGIHAQRIVQAAS